MASKRAYKMQQHDKKAAEATFDGSYTFPEDASTIQFASVDAAEMQTQDAGGNLRTPRLRQGEAFYKRILQTFNYGIFSKARNTHSLYFWNEVVGQKVVNNVLSAEHDHHMNMGTGAKHLCLWFDRCSGQCNNWAEVQYHIHITDEDAGMFMYDRIDSKTPISGHSYMDNDREFGNLQQAARPVPTISDMWEWMEIAGYCDRRSRACSGAQCRLEHTIPANIPGPDLAAAAARYEAHRSKPRDTETPRKLPEEVPVVTNPTVFVDEPPAALPEEEDDITVAPVIASSNLYSALSHDGPREQPDRFLDYNIFAFDCMPVIFSHYTESNRGVEKNPSFSLYQSALAG